MLSSQDFKKRTKRNNHPARELSPQTIWPQFIADDLIEKDKLKVGTFVPSFLTILAAEELLALFQYCCRTLMQARVDQAIVGEATNSHDNK